MRYSLCDYIVALTQDMITDGYSEISFAVTETDTVAEIAVAGQKKNGKTGFFYRLGSDFQEREPSFPTLKLIADVLTMSGEYEAIIRRRLRTESRVARYEIRRSELASLCGRSLCGEQAKNFLYAYLHELDTKES